MKKLLCGAMGLSLILGVLTGCGDTAKEISSSESTKETVIELAESTEKNNEVEETVAENIDEEHIEDETDDFVNEEIAKEDTEFNTNETITERSITDRLFDSSYKDFDEFSWDDLIVAIEDEGMRWEWSYEGESLYMLDGDKFGGYDCYSYFELEKSHANLAELDFIVDLGVGTEYKNNCEKLLTDLCEKMYDKDSEYHLLKPENGDWPTVPNVGIDYGDGRTKYGTCSFDNDVTDAYLYLLDVSDVDNNYRDDYINSIVSLISPTIPSAEEMLPDGTVREPINPEYTYWQNWDSDCKIIKICTVMFTNTPSFGSLTMENTHGAEIWVKWYFLDNERFTILFNEFGFTNPFE